MDRIIKYLVENCDSNNVVDAFNFFEDLHINDFEFAKSGDFNRLIRSGYIAKESDMARIIVTEKAKEYYRSNTP